jgi:hypothetical protein
MANCDEMNLDGETCDVCETNSRPTRDRKQCVSIENLNHFDNCIWMNNDGVQCDLCKEHYAMYVKDGQRRCAQATVEILHCEQVAVENVDGEYVQCDRCEKEFEVYENESLSFSYTQEGSTLGLRGCRHVECTGE